MVPLPHSPFLLVAPAGIQVIYHCQQNDDPFYDLLDKRLDGIQVHDILEHSHDQTAYDGPLDGAHAAQHADAAYDRGCDGLELIARARIRVAGIHPCHQHHSRQPMIILLKI